MSIETLGLVISLISLALGLLSSWQQIKTLVLRAAKFGGNAARSWVLRERCSVLVSSSHSEVEVGGDCA